MSIGQYQTAQVTEDPRSTEYRLMADVTRALMNVESHTPLDTGYQAAVDWNRRMWNTFEVDLASDRNTLPDPLKAQIISVAMWVDRHSAAVLRGDAGLESLITVNRAIMEGLTA